MVAKLPAEHILCGKQAAQVFKWIFSLDSQKSPIKWEDHYPRVMDKKIVGQGGQVTCPKSQSGEWICWDLDPAGHRAHPLVEVGL